MDILYLALAYVCAFIGLMGAIVPVLPGPPIGYITLVLLYFCDTADISGWTLLIMGVLMVVVTVFDYVAPAWMTKLKGGSKYSSYGAMIGLIVGLFLGPLGIIICPFAGAFIGELIANSSKSQAFKVALTSFYAFLLTSGVKLLYGAVVVVILTLATIDVIKAYL